VGAQTMACSSQFGSGLVSSQTPTAGSQAPPNSAVTLVISTGDCVQVPNVVGEPQQEAASDMSTANLTPVFANDTTCANGAQPGNVDSETPVAGSQVSSGSTVNMTVCQASDNTTTTTSAGGGGTTTTSSSQPGGGGIL